MARTTITTYSCDRCGKHVDKPRELRHFRLLNNGLGGRDQWAGTADTQLCAACVVKLHDAVEALGFNDLSDLIDAEALTAA